MSNSLRFSPSSIKSSGSPCIGVLLLLLCIFPVSAQDFLVEGQDYTRIPDPQTWQPTDGQIEIIEVFAYTCSHCAHLNPQIEHWASQLPDDVYFSQVPIIIGRDNERNSMRAYFAAQTLGLLEHTHTATFAAFHDSKKLPFSNPSLDEFIDFYASLGLDTEALSTAMRSEKTEQQIAHAFAFARHAGVQATPSIIVNGRYLVHGQDISQVLANANILIARERATRP